MKNNNNNLKGITVRRNLLDPKAVHKYYQISIELPG